MPDSRKSGDRPGRRGPLNACQVVPAKLAEIDPGRERYWVCAPALDGSGREVADFGAMRPRIGADGGAAQAAKVESGRWKAPASTGLQRIEVLEKDFKALLVDRRRLARVGRPAR